MLGQHVGRLLDGCNWVGVPFAGGMSELRHLKARTMLVNDLHRHVINLARVVASDDLRPELVRRLETKAFHPDELKFSQEVCSRLEPTWAAPPDLSLAEHYFVSAWMARAGRGGLEDEFTGSKTGGRGMSIRWNASGGDSNVRFRNAVAGLEEFSAVLKRCTFETMDALAFLARCEDAEGHGIYCDPPFPGPGRSYYHNCGKTEAEERDWHARLAEAVSRFQRCRVVMRFYDHPLIRELYPEGRWRWNLLKGRKQSNESAPEVLLVNQPDDSLFQA